MASNEMLKQATHFHDDFSNPFISATNGLMASRCLYALGTGTNTVSRLSINGGAARMTGDTNEAADMVLSGPLAFELDKCGLLTYQARIRLHTAVDHVSVFVGMWDIITTGQLSYEDASVVSTPTDAFGFFIEPEQSGYNVWSTIGVGNDVDDTVHAGTHQDAIVVDTWYTLRIEADDNNGSGVIRYRGFLNGNLITTASTDALGWTTSKARSTVVLAPVVARAGRATAYSVDVAELYCDASVGNAFD